MKQYEYRVCQTQGAAVTFVNGEWQGAGTPEDAATSNDPLAECPLLWDYLNEAGHDGWELVATAVRHPEQSSVEVLYLKKDRYG
ncbi:MAG: hypothetical protein ABI333_09220 [bacterium]